MAFQRQISRKVYFKVFYPININCKRFHGAKYEHSDKLLRVKTKTIQLVLENLCANAASKHFHTTSTRRAIHPIILAVMRTFLKGVAIIAGRQVRKKLPSDKRSFIADKIRKHLRKLAVGGIFSLAFGYFYYISHLVNCPITKRKKFSIFSEEEIIKLSMVEYEYIMKKFKKQIIKDGPLNNQVFSIAQRIINANIHLPGIHRNWRVVIIDETKIQNAFVLPSGHIFIFTGIFNIVKNENQLATLLSHEIAHVLLNHIGEFASKTHVMELIIIIPIFIIWTLLPDILAVTSTVYTEFICGVLFRLPMNRKLELEADVVGLTMMTRACYDPRETSAFWRNMGTLTKDTAIEWLSTHPSHKTRYTNLDKLIPGAMEFYKRNCE